MSTVHYATHQDLVKHHVYNWNASISFMLSVSQLELKENGLALE
jgi:hypothetical protein